MPSPTPILSLWVVALAVLLPGSVLCLDNGLALVPPLGWRSGERFGCNTDCRLYPNDCISETLVRTTADHLANNGYVSLGYRYLILDECWQNLTRGAGGELIPDPKRFPSGMRTLADYVRGRGLVLGLRLSTGQQTCRGRPGSRGRLAADAATMAAWGVGWVTLDGCGAPGEQQTAGDYSQAYQEFGRALNQTGRRIVYECMWPANLKKMGAQVDWSLVARTCNLWQQQDEAGDPAVDGWESLKARVKALGEGGELRDAANVTGPGAWNNPGQLLIGDFGLSENQQRLQLAVWAVAAAPLLVSADLRAARQEATDLLQGKAVLNISQDARASPGTMVAVHGQVTIWRRPVLPPGSFALTLMYTNISGGPSKVSVRLQDLGLTTAAAYHFIDGFTGKDRGVYKPWYTWNCELLIGDFGLSENQQRLQLGVWAVAAAPLVVSADLRAARQEATDLLQGKAVLGISQDASASPGTMVAVHGQVTIWRRPVLPPGSFALTLMYTNISGGPSKVSVRLQDLGLTTAAAYHFIDGFTGKDRGVYKPWYTWNCEVNPTGAVLVMASALP